MKTKYAYIAGLIDGEGCIYIRKDNYKAGCLNPRYTLEVNIGNTDRKMLEFVQSVFGGRIYPKLYKNDPKRKLQWRIVFCSGQAYELLIKVKPYLITKLNEAELAIKFQEAIWEDRGQNFHPLSKIAVEKREALYQQLRRFHNPPTETKQESGLTNRCDSPTS